MTLSETQILGFVDGVGGLFDKERRTLAAAGVEVDKVTGKLEALRQRVIDLAADQENLKRDTGQTTQDLMRLLHELYVYASGMLDAAMFAVSKDSLQARNFRRLRSRIKRPNGNGGNEVFDGESGQEPPQEPAVEEDRPDAT